MNKNRFKLDFKFIFLIVVILIISYLFVIRMRKKEEEKSEILTPVSVVSPYKGKLTKGFRINSHIESETMVTILPRVSGTLLELNVDVGDYVKKGDKIGQIDSEPLQLTLNQAEAAYNAAKSSYQRVEELYKANAVSKQNYDQAKSQYDAYKSQYELARLQFEYSKIISPVSGTVLIKHTTVGSLVAPTVPIITIGDINNLIIKSKIPEKYYETFIKKSNKIKINIIRPDYSDEVFSAEIKSISPYISPETKNFEIIGKIKHSKNILRPGMFVYCDFIIDETNNVYYLPYDVKTASGDVWYVSNNFAYKLINNCNFENDKYFQIEDKYSNYKIIIEGQHFLKEGQKVKVVSGE